MGSHPRSWILCQGSQKRRLQKRIIEGREIGNRLEEQKPSSLCADCTIDDVFHGHVVMLDTILCFLLISHPRSWILCQGSQKRRLQKRIFEGSEIGNRPEEQ